MRLPTRLVFTCERSCSLANPVPVLTQVRLQRTTDMGTGTGTHWLTRALALTHEHRK
jgi:hypothetical protein